MARDAASVEALLRSHQDTIYTVCFHVLRNVHDAEDAAQEALVKLARSPDSWPSEAALKSWICRLALNAALDLRRRRRTRVLHESRTPIMPPPADPAEGEALGRAIAGLDDALRVAVVEHFFEKATLEEIAARQSCSVAAVWKRIARAKEALKAALIGMGAGVAAANLDSVLARLGPMRAPEGLLAASMAATVSPVVIGGMLMSSKPIAWSVAALALVAALGGGMVVGRRMAVRESQETRRETAVEPRRHSSSPEERPDSSAKRTKSSPEFSAPIPPKATNISPLQSRLESYRRWKRSAEERMADIAKDPGSEASLAKLERLYEEESAELAGIRALALEDPETFARFLRDPENGLCHGALVRELLLGSGSNVPSLAGLHELPGPIADALMDGLRNGTPEQKAAALAAVRFIGRPGEELRSLVASLVESRDPSVQQHALNCLGNQAMSPETAVKVQAIAESTPYASTAELACRALARSGFPSAMEYLFQRLDQGTSQAAGPARDAILSRISLAAGAGTPDAALQARFARSLAGAIARHPDEYYLNMRSALRLPSKDLVTVLEAAAASGPAQYRPGAARILEMVRAGESRYDALYAALALSLAEGSGKEVLEPAR